LSKRAFSENRQRNRCKDFLSSIKELISMTKTYVLDTNVLLHDPEALFAFEDNAIVLPFAVI
jgi:hypothetical protein